MQFRYGFSARIASALLILAVAPFALASRNTAYANANAGTAQAEANPVVILETNQGTITIELDAKNAPISTKNFLTYVDAKFYDGKIFHRVIPGFMIQGGGYDQKYGEPGTRAPIANEAGNGLKNLKGTIAMARTNDPDSATAQFFINVADNDFLNRNAGSAGYAVFGKVTAGLDIVEKIEKIPTGRGGPFPTDVPKTPVVIKSVKRKAAK